MELTIAERGLLQWLGESEMSQYGECHGSNLDSLIAHGLAEVMGEESGTENDFVAKGRGVIYRGVRLTDTGRRALVGKDA